MSDPEWPFMHCSRVMRYNQVADCVTADISRTPLLTMRMGVGRRPTVAASRRRLTNNHRLDYHRRSPKVIRSRVRAHPVPQLYQMALLTRIHSRTFTRKLIEHKKLKKSTNDASNMQVHNTDTVKFLAFFYRIPWAGNSSAYVSSDQESYDELN